MLCLDTYALVEIGNGNEKFINLLKNKFVIPNEIMAEFYNHLLKAHNEKTANYWYRKLEQYCQPVSTNILIEAIKFKHNNRKIKYSFFDCVGYMYAVLNGLKFVTGDKEFKGMKNVLYIK